jgi:hypothetical protein
MFLRVALGLVFEDDPTSRKEGNENEEGEGGAFARRKWEGANACCGWV